ncbi:MAG: SAM-dependent methyltransferase [Bacteroidales bacterium]|jgi:hypothetical protein
MLTDREILFIREHLHKDVHGLLLEKHKYPDIDVPKCAVQIEGLERIKHKVPEWYACSRIFIPSLRAVEQASSAETARYKQRFLKTPGTVVDMTGGLGVDVYYFSAVSKQVIYAEEDAYLCQAARYNFDVLQVANRIQVEQQRAEELWSRDNKLPYADLVYADPSRRRADGSRLRGLASYSPDVTQLAGKVLQRAGAFLVKIGPLEDVNRTLQRLPDTTEIHVVSVRNECKELLFLLKKKQNTQQPPLVVCSGGFSFYGKEETAAAATLNRSKEYGVVKEGDYLYEPEVSLLKAGAFALPSFRFEVQKIHRHSHLYVSSRPVVGFPGKLYRIRQAIPFSSARLKRLAAQFPRAHMKVRNFPLTVEAWRKKTGIAEGGTDVLFGTTAHQGGKDIRWIIHATLWEENI